MLNYDAVKVNIATYCIFVVLGLLFSVWVLTEKIYETDRELAVAKEELCKNRVTMDSLLVECEVNRTCWSRHVGKGEKKCLDSK